MADTSFLQDSVVAYPQSLGLFGRPVQSVGIRKVLPIPHNPTGEFSNHNVIKFDVKSAGSSYIDLSKTMVRITGKIVRGDNASISEIGRRRDGSGYRMKISPKKPHTSGDGKKEVGGTSSEGGEHEDDGSDSGTTPQIIAPENNFLHTAFERVDIWIQDQLVTSSNDLYPYLAYHKAIQAPASEKHTSLQMQMFFEPSDDDLPPENDADWVYSRDKNFQRRAAKYGGSREVTLMGRLASDIFSVDRLLPHGVGFKIAMYPHRGAFCLLSPDIQPPPDFKFVVTNATLLVAFVHIAPEIIAAHDTLLKEGHEAFFPFTKTDIRLVDVPQGSYSVEIPNPYNGRQPAELVVGIIDSRARHGDYGMSALQFERCDLKLIQCLVDNQHLGNSPINMRYGNTYIDSEFTQAYETLRGFGGNTDVMPFSMNTYFNKLPLYRFVSQGDEESSWVGQPGSVLPLRRNGNVKLVLQFGQALKTPKTVVMFGQFPGGFKLTSNRDVLLM